MAVNVDHEIRPPEEVSTSPLLFSGRMIPDAPIRHDLDALIVDGLGWNEKASGDPIVRFDQIAETPGYTLVARRDPNKDYHFRAAEYVFWMMKEPWSPKQFKAFYADQIWFLQDHDYEFVNTPESNDIVGYTFSDINEEDTPFFHHFGIYKGFGMVESKFATGHVFSHPWNVLPAVFGDQLQFIRKRTSPEGISTPISSR